MTKKLIVIKGKVTSGLGQGQFYICQEAYLIQFQQKLGFQPYPGTLNLKLEKPFVQSDLVTIEIRSFQEAGRTFGGCRCYSCQIGDMRCFIIKPDRSSHPSDLIEIIAPVNLRRSLDLMDGDEVELVLGN
ncbi:MAG: CTP-dependent riboflavin kinase [Methanotrichaceae archaeon]|nr:CTP-dependent riboflavin kinase [Methanotrichaceae archaeon]